MNNFIKKMFLSLLLIIVLAFSYYIYVNVNIINFKSTKGIIIIASYVIVLLVNIIYAYYYNVYKSPENKYKDKLLNSLLKNTDTIYLMYLSGDNNPIYITKNVNDVLDLPGDENINASKYIVAKIFDTPIIKEEIRKWDKKSEFISQMFSYRHNANSNTIKRLRVKIYPFTDKKNNYQIRLITDATKDYEKQHKLVMQAQDIKAREKKLNQITSASYDFAVNINLGKGVYELQNLTQGFDLFGKDSSGNFEKDFEELINKYVHDEEKSKLLEQLSIENFKKLVSNNKLEPFSITYRLSNETDVKWLESTVFFTIVKGEEQVTILSKNVTENAEYMRSQNALLQEALDATKSANIAKTDFLSVISHEIRTPMNAIIGLSESVLSNDLSMTTREDVESINSASKNLLEIFDEILDISKIESGILERNDREYDVSKMFLDIINITKERVQPKKLKLDLNIDSKIPSKLFGDVGKIRQVLLNIINNAIEYTDQGTITITGSSEIKNHNTELIISIKDTGVGIKPDKLDKLFEEDSLDNDLIARTHGMGLLISKRMIDLLNGKIIVESIPDEGTTFTITVNQKVIDDNPIGDVENYRATKKRAISFDAKGKSVLIVDDNKLNIKVAEKLLKPYNLKLKSVEGGKECIDLIKKNNKFDLILLDQMMPEMDGIETLKQLKQIKSFNTPVVVITADAIVGVKEKYLNEGFDDYMSKPIDVNELNHLLKKYLLD